MDLQFDNISEEVIGDHCYSAWVVKDNWQQVIAQHYQDLLMLSA